MVVKLYGTGYSTGAQRVATVLEEKSIPYESFVIDLYEGEHKMSEHVEKQPFGQVPYIVDEDGTVIYESRAIARYLDAKYPDHGPRLSVSPSDPLAFGKYEQACASETANFDAFAGAAVLLMVVWPTYAMKVDKELGKQRLRELEGKLDAYEVILSKQKYLAGEEYTLADLFHLPYGTMLPMCGFHGLVDGSRPNVARWWKDISSRPAWLAVKDEFFFKYK